MRAKPVWAVILLLPFRAGFAEGDPSDSTVTKALLGEVHQLRQDLRATAALIQRVQIVMYRLQSESAQHDRVTQRLEQARVQCEQAQQQQKWAATRIEEAETRRRDAASAEAQKAAEASLTQLKSNLEMWAGREQACQVERVESENQVRAEQARMNELLDQLDRFDKLMAAYLGK